MRFLMKAVAVAGVLALGACAATPGEDYGFDSKKLSSLSAIIWVDPKGCEHWVIDDGVEGYMSPALLPDGRPDCV